jgi:hypothetical protein
MRAIVFRVLGGAVGLFAALVAIVVPLSFVSNELQEVESARQYGGHLSFPGAVGGSLAVLVVTGFFALIAFALLKFSLPGAKSRLTHCRLKSNLGGNFSILLKENADRGRNK